MNKKIISTILLMVLILAFFATTCHASASAKVFSSSQSSYYQSCASYASSGLSSLGYSCTTTMGPITRDSILSWIKNTGNGYAMYVHTLGGTGYFNDYYGNSINSSMISGNWDFVYIDSSYSAANNSLATAFHTTGYSNRCFLGWYNAITTSNSNTFNYYFWLEYVGKSSIRVAALNASSCVPGSGTTPIRLYGSTTYTGAAR